MNTKERLRIVENRIIEANNRNQELEAEYNRIMTSNLKPKDEPYRQVRDIKGFDAEGYGEGLKGMIHIKDAGNDFEIIGLGASNIIGVTGQFSQNLKGAIRADLQQWFETFDNLDVMSNPNRIVYDQDFEGPQLLPPEFVVLGTGGGGFQVSSFVNGTVLSATGGSGSAILTHGGNKIWKANDLFFACRERVGSITNRQDGIGVYYDPLNYIRFYFNGGSWIFESANGQTVRSEVMALNPQSSNFNNFQFWARNDGSVQYSVSEDSGSPVMGIIQDGVDPTVLMEPYIGTTAMTSTSQAVRLDYIHLSMNR